jgi:uncharacterized protein YbjT (DUF2867 family)
MKALLPQILSMLLLKQSLIESRLSKVEESLNKLTLIMKAFVAGATGETGRRIVQELVSRQIPVRALVRNLSLAQEILPATVEMVPGDLAQPDTIKAAMQGCSVVLCATGARPSWDMTGPYSVDYEGTKRLVDLAKAQGIEHFVLVSSLCVSQLFHPLNLFWLILLWKKWAEDYLRQSGLSYTIVRPGGLRNEESSDPLLLSAADTLFEGSVPRSKVAQVCVEALLSSAARNKIVEVIAQADAPSQPLEAWFANLPG